MDPVSHPRRNPVGRLARASPPFRRIQSAARGAAGWLGRQVGWLRRRLEDPETRPFTVLILVIILAQTWTVSLFATIDRAPALRWFQNHLTFSLVHWTAFAWAVSIASVTFGPRKYSRILGRGSWEFGSYAALALMATIATVATVQDFSGNRPEPYMLRDARSATRAEGELRRHYDDLQPEAKGADPARAAGYAAELNGYNARFYGFDTTKPWKHINVLAYVTFGLTWFFTMLVVALAWAIAVALPLMRRRINNARLTVEKAQAGAFLGFAKVLEELRGLRESEEEFRRVLNDVFKVYILVVSWIPFRVYTTWYQNYYLLNGKVVYPGVVLLAILAVVFLTILMVLKRGTDVLAMIGAVYGVLLGAVGLLGKFKPEVLGGLLESLKQLLNAGLSFFLILCATVFLFSFAIYMVSAGGDHRPGLPLPDIGEVHE
jgi:hypothetical protein